MGTKTWNDLADGRFSTEEREKIKASAHAELERVGLAALRKAREHTQAELASEMGLPQNSVSDIERRTDLLLTTLAKYIRALGGELEIHAIFPEATFNIDPQAILGEYVPAKAKPTKAAKRTAAVA